MLFLLLIRLLAAQIQTDVRRDEEVEQGKKEKEGAVAGSKRCSSSSQRYGPPLQIAMAIATHLALPEEKEEKEKEEEEELMEEIYC